MANKESSDEKRQEIEKELASIYKNIGKTKETPFKSIARTCKEMFDSFREVGFTAEQALHLTVKYQLALFTHALNKADMGRDDD